MYYKYCIEILLLHDMIIYSRFTDAHFVKRFLLEKLKTTTSEAVCSVRAQVFSSYNCKKGSKLSLPVRATIVRWILFTSITIRNRL